ncbi:MAG: hypothetical protein F6K39_28370, partial [Okeania sp. SIO3B3]|nr:hypothetical protein [Okeania sp. SIO3B3]
MVLPQELRARGDVDYGAVYDQMLSAVEEAGFSADDLDFTRAEFVDMMPEALE